MPEEEIKNLLKEDVEISRESLKILKSIRRANRLSMAFKIVYWLIILGIVAGVYYFVEPYIRGAVGAVQQVQQMIPGNNKVNGTQNTSSDLLKNLPPSLVEQLQDFFKTK